MNSQKFSWGKISILREAQYKHLAATKLNGLILDLGGSTNSGYQELMPGKKTFITANIDKNYGCSIICDLEKQFPFEASSFDGITAINFLEHIFNTNHIIRESARVLRSGGKIVMSHPFMFHIHSSPRDFYRLTSFAMNQLLKDNGFKNITITPLGFGLSSLIYQTTIDIYPDFTKPFIKAAYKGIDSALNSMSQKYRNLTNRIPLGYFITAIKK